MHEIEPFANWQHLYLAEEDERSPFWGREYSEFEFSNTVYNYYIHPLWDEFGSATLYVKVLFVDYELGCCIMEFLGEWNDAVENDIMHLKRNVIDPLLENGIYKFILIAENVLNYHSSDDSYYEEWLEEVEDKSGWIVFLNTPFYEKSEFEEAHINRFCYFLEDSKWRTYQPMHLFQTIEEQILREKKEDAGD